MVGEFVAVALAQVRWPAGLDTTGTLGVHKVPYIQSRAEILLGVKLAARVEGQAALADDFRRQGNIGGDDEIAGVEPFDDLVVGNVETVIDLQYRDMVRTRDAQRFVGDQRYQYAGAVRCRVEDFLYNDRTRVRVDPYFHRLFHFSKEAVPVTRYPFYCLSSSAIIFVLWFSRA